MNQNYHQKLRLVFCHSDPDPSSVRDHGTQIISIVWVSCSFRGFTLWGMSYNPSWWTLCSPNHFAPWNTLHPNSLCSTHFTPWHTLLFSTLWSSAHFNHRSTLLPGTLCSLEHLTPWNTLLPGTLCFKCSREQRMLRRTIYKLAKCSKEQSVPGSKVCWEAKCSRKQSVPRRRVF